MSRQSLRDNVSFTSVFTFSQVLRENWGTKCVQTTGLFISLWMFSITFDLKDIHLNFVTAPNVTTKSQMWKLNCELWVLKCQQWAGRNWGFGVALTKSGSESWSKWESHQHPGFSSITCERGIWSALITFCLTLLSSLYCLMYFSEYRLSEDANPDGAMLVGFELLLARVECYHLLELLEKDQLGPQVSSNHVTYLPYYCPIKQQPL